MSTHARLARRISLVVPGRIALRQSPDVLTYGDLNHRANVMASYFISLGVGVGDAVAICLPRSFDQVVAQLAALRAGAAFVPMDPALPEERIQYILRDSAAKVFVAPASLSQRVTSDAQCVDVVRDQAAISAANPAVIDALETSDHDLAYIIYTSGSTGAPKGVEITLGNLEHLIAWHLAQFEVSETDRATYLAGLGFDASIWELWPYLAIGASVSLVDDLTRVDPTLLQNWIVENEITISFIPTPIAEPLLAKTWPADTKLRRLLTGGDTLHAAPIEGLPFVTINNYGPTECTVVATSGVTAPLSEGLPTIGRGITNTSIYVLDDQLTPVAPGDTGELYIAGGSVGRGYRNLPEQTAQSFLPDHLAGTGRMYKSGDRVKLLPNGELLFMGRLDSQEKIRGNRLELDEIASALDRHPEVAFSVVATSTEASQEKYLIAYVLPVADAMPTAQGLREHLAKMLPSYMVPAKFVRLTALPLSLNGKVDRSTLPSPEEENALPERASRAPNTELEQILLSLVRSLLHTDSVGVDTDFFLAGGHSLLGTQLVMRTREAFGVTVSLRDLFETGTVAGLAERIEDLMVAEVNAMSEEEAVRMASDKA